MRFLVLCLFCLLSCTAHAAIIPYSLDEELGLVELIDIALRNNRDTYIAWANVRARRATYCQSKSDNFPSVAYEGVGRYEHLSRRGDAADRTDSNYAQALAVDYLLFDFGSRYYGHESTYFALRSAIYDRDWVIETVVLEVIQTYTEYLNALESLTARLADQEDTGVNLEITDALYKAGIKTRSDMLQARTANIESQIQREVAQGAVEITLGRLKNALGVPMDTPIKVKGLSADFQPYEINDKLNDLIEMAKVYRKDLQAAYALVKQRKANLKFAQVNGSPTLNTSWVLSRQSGVRPRENYRSDARFIVSVPIFEGFFFKNGIRRAKAELDLETAVFENDVLEAALEVLTNYYAFQTAYQTYQYTEQFLKDAQESYEATLANYKAGVSSLQSLFNAQTTLATARSQHIQAKTAWILSLSQLTYSTGVIMSVDKPIYKHCS